MSHNQNQNNSQHAHHHPIPTLSVAAPTTPVRPGTTQSMQLPPFSSLFEAGPVPASTATMASIPSQNNTEMLEAPSPFQGRSPRNGTDVRTSMSPNHLIPSTTGNLTNHDQGVLHPGSSSYHENTNCYHSPNAGPQPVGSTLKVPSNATSKNTYHVAIMEENQLVVNIEQAANQSNENELVPWEPRKSSDGDSPRLPFNSVLDSKDHQESGYRRSDDSILGKRSRQFSETQARKKKSTEDSNLAASLDALAREHARSTMSSSTISIPSSVSTRNGDHGNEVVHGPGCQDLQVMDTRVTQSRNKISMAYDPKSGFQKNNDTSQLQTEKTVEPGNELDFLASVILSQKNAPTPTAEGQESGSGIRTGSTVVQGMPNLSDPSQAAQNQTSQPRHLGDTEPRSEASFSSEDEPILPKMMQELGQRSSVILSNVMTEESVANMENPVPNQAQVSASPSQPHETRRNAQSSAPRISAMAQLPKNVGGVGCVIAKGGIGYKLKRGPKSKKHKENRGAASNGSKGRTGKESIQKKNTNAGPASEVRTGPFVKTKEIPTTHRVSVKGKHDKLRSNQKSSGLSRSVCSGPSSKASATYKERMLLADMPSSSKASRKNYSRSKDITREGKAPLDQEEVTAVQDMHRRDGHLSQKQRPLRYTANTSSALSVVQGIQSKSNPNPSGVDRPTKVVKNLIEQMEKEASSKKTPAVAKEVSGPPPIPLESIIAAAKQSPPYDHKCQQCDSVFNRRFNLNKHIRNVHENIRKFPCTTCGEFFLQKSHLAAHSLAVHDKSRPFQCDLCPKSFSWIGVLRKHMQSIHNVTLQRKVTRKTRSPVLKSINGDMETIHPIRLNVGNAGTPSSSQKVITSPTASVAVTPQNSMSANVQRTS